MDVLLQLVDETVAEVRSCLRGVLELPPLRWSVSQRPTPPSSPEDGKGGDESVAMRSTAEVDLVDEPLALRLVLPWSCLVMSPTQVEALLHEALARGVLRVALRDSERLRTLALWTKDRGVNFPTRSDERVSAVAEALWSEPLRVDRNGAWSLEEGVLWCPSATGSSWWPKESESDDEI